jgi:hypothetical protein
VRSEGEQGIHKTNDCAVLKAGRRGEEPLGNRQAEDDDETGGARGALLVRDVDAGVALHDVVNRVLGQVCAVRDDERVVVARDELLANGVEVERKGDVGA